MKISYLPKILFLTLAASLAFAMPVYAVQVHGATLELTSTSAGQVDILISTDISINAVGVVIYFDPGLVAVTKLDFDNSFCLMFIEKVIDESQGQIRISCGLPNPGFTGKGIVGSIRFTKKDIDPARFAIANDSEILANDGLGTNIFEKAKSITILK